MSYMVFGLAY